MVRRPTLVRLSVAALHTSDLAGMRKSSQILIFVDVQKALGAGVKFYLSANGVVLTEGDDQGFLRPEFFSRVETADRKALTGWDGLPGTTTKQDPAVVTPATCPLATSQSASVDSGRDMNDEAAQAEPRMSEIDVQSMAEKLESTGL